MCGIAGIVRLDGAAVSRGIEGHALGGMTEQIAHRGPDDEQFLFWDNVALGFRRLSIVDVAGGRQPLFNEAKTVALICNGEIYNHRDLRRRFARAERFRSQSDCEIIPHLYDAMGMAHLDQLNGIFAYALLDREKGKLFLCRDRLGVKPLFYYRDKDLLVFGSEVKAVLAHPSVPKRFDWAAALTFRNRMYHPYQPELTSFFENVTHLPAAHYLEIDLKTGAVGQHAYWRPDRQGEGDDDRAGYVRRYQELLADAVQLQLMADVPSGIFLSGGIDSIAVAYFASLHGAPHTFSVLSQSTLTNGDAPNAHAAAKAFGLPGHMVHFDWRSLDISPSLWRTIVWKVEMPIAGAEQFYKYLLHAHAREQVNGLKVMLLGSGSDEFNGGYSKTGFNSAKDPSWQNFERTLKCHERESFLRKSGAWSSYASLQFGDDAIISTQFLASLAHQRRHETPWSCYRDLYLRLLQMYQLWHEDRTSSANAIEARVPFLDHRLVELTWSVPSELHEDLFWDKAILREALKGQVPDQFRQRAKTPFFFGDDVRYTRRLLYNMLCANGRSLLEEALAEGDGCAGVMNAGAVRRLFDELRDDPEYANIDLLLDLVNMGLLAAIAKAECKPDRLDAGVPVAEVVIDDWCAWEERNAVALVRRAPALTRRSVLRFADGIRVVKTKAGDPLVAEEGGYCVLRNNDLEFSLEPSLAPWIRFLHLVDGARSVDRILTEADLIEKDVWKHLEEAVEYDVLNVVPHTN